MSIHLRGKSLEEMLQAIEKIHQHFEPKLFRNLSEQKCFDIRGPYKKTKIGTTLIYCFGPPTFILIPNCL